jgi:hypothetical protein
MDDQATLDDLLDYMTGVYKVLTGDNLSPVVAAHPDLAKPLNKIINTLAPYAAYRMTRKAA